MFVSSCGAGAARAPSPRARSAVITESLMMDVEEDEELVGFARFSGFEMRRVAASPVSMEPYMCLLHWYCI